MRKAPTCTPILSQKFSFSAEKGVCVCVYLRVGCCEPGSPHCPLLAEQVRYSPNTL